MNEAAKQALLDTIAALGITYTAEFVPFSKSRNAGPGGWESINWRVKLERNGQRMETDYSQGIGHLPFKLGGMRRTLDVGRAIRDAIETGVCARVDHTGHPVSFPKGAKLQAPPLSDILYSLCMDASVIDYGTFEDWAADFGMDTDSRSAEATYRQCLELALKLRAMLGDSTLSALREAFQDY